MAATKLVYSGEISSGTRLSNIGIRNFLQEVVEQCTSFYRNRPKYGDLARSWRVLGAFQSQRLLEKYTSLLRNIGLIWLI